MTALDKALAVLRIYCAGQGDNEFLSQAEAELRRLHEVNAELLEVLKEVCDETRHPDYDWSVDLAQRVRAAIAKAEDK
jgi:hypothetical protein